MKEFGVFISLILILGFSSCTSRSSYPPCLSPPRTPIHKRLFKAIQVVNPDNQYTYEYEVNGRIEEEDKVWNKVSSSEDSVFTQISITNIFKKEGIEREYYALEQIIDVRDSSRRQPVIEYQFVVNKDTAYIRLADQKELRYTGYSYGNFYLLEGYAHKGNPVPEQYRWWSPEFGDVLTWYGEQRFLKLKEPLPDEIRTMMAGLKNQFQKTEKP